MRFAHRRPLVVTAISLVCCFSSAPARAQEWTRFRGPNGTGLAPSDKIPTEWTASDYAWKLELPGVGHSSPVLWGDKLFLTSADEESAERIVLCIDALAGKILWQKRYPSTAHPKHLRNSFASASPAVDAHHVYVAWTAPSEYTLLALDHQGKEAWRRDLGPFDSQHSGGTSPIVYEDLVILGNDQDGVSFLAAVNASDGQDRWRTERRSAVVAYSTPCVYQPTGGKPELIFNSQAHGISAIDPVTGKTDWELEVFDKRSVSSPIVAGGLIFGSCGSGGGGGGVMAVKPGPEPKLAYKVTDAAPYVPTLIAKGPLLFLWSDKGIVSCLRAATGEAVWRERVGGNYSGSPIIAGEHLYCIADDGTVVVLDASENYRLVARNALGEDSRSTPAVVGDRMYLRTFSHLFCLGPQNQRTAKAD